MAPPTGPVSRKAYRVESDLDDTDGADGMDVVPPTPAAASKGAKGRKSAAALPAGIKRSGSGRVTRNSRKSEAVENMELD